MCQTVTEFLLSRYNDPAKGYVGPVTPCTETEGQMPNSAINYMWNNYGRTYRGAYMCPLLKNGEVSTHTSFYNYLRMRILDVSMASSTLPLYEGHAALC